MLIAAAAAVAGGWYTYQRFFCGNFHVIVDGEAYRSAQPTPQQLRQWARQYGLKTIINLRGVSSGEFYARERQAAAAAGVEVIDIKFSAVRLPTVPWLRRFIEAIETAERPILLHCRDGADRTGVAGVITAMAIGGQHYEAARSQLSARYLHFDDSPEHIAGLLLRYEA
ncbi:MAG: tyrosine-protein phosphatase, partial [Phycisphaerae bacterium]|nr:tyrosine-protein phosphatase [Phycisphaerae bacterium]